jgi:hypothetical protein
MSALHDGPVTCIMTPDGIVHEQLWMFNAPYWTRCEYTDGAALYGSKDLRRPTREIVTCIRCIVFAVRHADE